MKTKKVCAECGNELTEKSEVHINLGKPYDVDFDSARCCVKWCKKKGIVNNKSKGDEKNG